MRHWLVNGRIKYVAITSSRKCYLPLLAVVDASVIIVKITRSGISCYKFMNSNVKCAIHTSTCQCLLTGTSAVHNVGLLNFEGISTKVTLVTLQRKASNRKNIYTVEPLDTQWWITNIMKTSFARTISQKMCPPRENTDQWGHPQTLESVFPAGMVGSMFSISDFCCH